MRHSVINESFMLHSVSFRMGGWGVWSSLCMYKQFAWKWGRTGREYHCGFEMFIVTGIFQIFHTSFH